MDVIGTIDVADEPLGFATRHYTRGGGVCTEAAEIQRESLLSVYVNDIPTMQIGCSASNLVDLVCGRLFTEGLVRSLDEIDALSVCEQSLRADVILRDRNADLSRRAARMVPTCCTNNITLNDYFGIDEPLRPVKPIPWDAEWVFSIADVFALDHTAHSRTRGAHSAYLADRAGVLYVREDIGRHNAFDKVIGSALIDNVDLAQCLLFTSGRVPTDMAVKAVRAGIPLLVSKAVATDKTIEMAQAYDLTLVCNATVASFDVVCDPRVGKNG